jgi:peptide/nickel transport system permease protein
MATLSTTASNKAPPGHSSSLLKKAIRNRSVQIGGGVILFYVACALLGPLIWSNDPFSQDLSARLLPPIWDARGDAMHPLGTDQLGRDVLARLLYGSRVSLVIGFGASLIGAIIGISLGTCAGFFGKSVDQAVMFALTAKLALPNLLLAMTLIYFIEPSVTTVICVIGVLHWSLYLTVTRSATMRIRELDYVKASILSGARVRQIIMWDILPNLAGPILVVFTFEVAVSILAEASLSFLGVGVPSPIPSWGLMISEGKGVMFLRPSLVFLPGAAVFLLVISVNMLGDGLRDVIQPQSRN